MLVLCIYHSESSHPIGEIKLHSLKKFLDNYDTPQTKLNFKVSITQFLESVYGKKNIESLEDIVDQYFKEERDSEDDVNTFLNSLTGLAPLTRKLKISNVKNFLIENDVELSQKFWKKTGRRIKGSRALTIDRIPTVEELKQILSHLPIQGKALYLTLESSGMRIGELLKSFLSDVHIDETPARIQLRGAVTKSGNSRNVFFSKEAKEALVEWLKVREGYLKSAVGKSHLFVKNLNDPRVFPFDPSTAYSMWKKALHNSMLNGKDTQTNREKLHPHVLRKYFRTRLGAVIPVDIVEALMGHEGYLTEVYRKYTIEDLRKFYLKGESALLVFTDTQKIVEFQQTITKENQEMQKKVDETNKSLQSLVTELTTKNLSLENKLTNISSENQNLKKRVDNLEKSIDEVKDIKEKLAKFLTTEK